MNRTILKCLILGFVLLGLAAESKEETVGTAFTYQGRVVKDDTPVTGLCDFVFTLWDAASDGSQQGDSPQSADGVSVEDGLFTVTLDFGSDAFNGEARYLEIAVECPPGDGAITLDGRQQLTPAPHAVVTAMAPWNGLADVPAGFADNIDNDTLADLICVEGQIAKYTGGMWLCGDSSGGWPGIVAEAGEFNGEVNSDYVEIDEPPWGETVVSFAVPFTTTEKPEFLVAVVLKQAADGLTEGAAIKAVEDIKGSPGNWTGFDLTVSKYSTGASISDTTQVYVTWIAVSGSAAAGGYATDIVTGTIPWDNNPPYVTDIGFIKDVSSEIPTGFTLIDVTAKGRKAHQITGEIQHEPPLLLYPKVNGTSIEILVWDASGDEYGGSFWANMKADIEYTLFMEAEGGTPLPGGKRAVAGQVTGLPPSLDNITMPAPLPGADSSNTYVVVAGFKVEQDVTTPLAVRGTVQSSDLISFEVWDLDGNGYAPAAWDSIEINYCVVDR